LVRGCGRNQKHLTQLIQGERFAYHGNRMAVEAVPAYSPYRSGPAGHAYNEAAFRHFLAVDRRRAERSTRSLLLVLVTTRQGRTSHARLEDATAAAIFAGLGECVREIDFVGWYREGRVAAAVLAQGVKASAEMRDRTAKRIVHAMKKRLSDAHATSLRVRVVSLGGRVRK